MTQARPRLDDDIAAEVKAFADSYGKKLGVRVPLEAAVTILLRRALRQVKGDGNDENDS